MSEEIIKVKLVNKSDNPNPTYAHIGDSGMDVRANEDVFIPVGSTKKVHTGLYMEIPLGYEIQVRTKSGLSLEGAIVKNSPGTVDASYRGELIIIIHNINCDNDNEGDTWGWGYQVKKGNRVAQIVLQKVPVIEWDIVESLDALDKTSREDKGFGSTGI